MRLGKKQTLTAVLLMGLTLPAYAGHGRLATTDRDSWINLEAADLVSSGLVPQPEKPIAQMTNLEVAQLTAQAGQRFYAQAELPPPLPGGGPALPPPELPGSPTLPGAVTAPEASKSLNDLVEEFRAELSAMGTDVDKLEQRIQDAKDRNEAFDALQQEYLKRTGTDLGGFSRGYVNNYRGFGLFPGYPPMDYNAVMFMEMDLRSVPVPFLLFDARVRTIRSIGMYYADPISPHYELRWLQLSNFNEICSLTAGDFFKSYTPLTLWNYDVPVYTFVEPTPFYRTRKDVEEWVYMDHGNDEHLRGFQAATTISFDKDPFLSHLKLQAMGGPMNTATAFTYGSYFAGTQGSFSILNDNLEVGGTGLLLWQDPSSANAPYLPDFANTWAHQYQIGSISGRVTIPFADKINVTASTENAGSQYNDDARVPQRVFNDWAMLANGSLNIEGFHLTGKYLNVGPYFYSPGAQTNRVEPGTGTDLLDDSKFGYLNNTPFQGVFRPFFATYDRLEENALPYGDSTPNRQGIVLGFNGEIGDGGWFKPQASFTSVQEIQPNFVLKPDGTGLVAVDSNTNTAAARTFTGFEGALTVDFAKAFDLSGRTFDIQFDLKHQETDLGLGVDPFTVNTTIAACDFNIPAHFLNTVVWSAAFENVQSSGSEYVLNQGNPPTFGQYSFMLDESNLGQYAYLPLNLTKQTFAFGMKLPLNDIANFRADYFLTQYNWSDFPAYTHYDEIWRLGYYVKF